MEITLDALLQSRDARHALQQQLLQQHPGSTLVCMTVVMPGSVKRNLYSVVTAQAAITVLLERLGEHVQATRTRDLATGYEAYLITDLPALEAKRVTCDIEDSHPLGRLFDIDVMGADGTPIPRQAVGGEPRRCLLCDNEARWCMRNHSHSQEELMAHIRQLIDDYVR